MGSDNVTRMDGGNIQAGAVDRRPWAMGRHVYARQQAHRLEWYSDGPWGRHMYGDR